MKFTLKDSFAFSWEGLKARSYNSKKEFANASASFFQVTKSHGKVKSKVSDRIYYIVGGTGYFVIKGEKFFVSKTDVVIVPKNTPYDYFSTGENALELFMVHTPAYDESKEVQMSD